MRVFVPKGNFNVNGALCFIRKKFEMKKISKEFKFLLFLQVILVHLVYFDFELILLNLTSGSVSEL